MLKSSLFFLVFLSFGIQAVFSQEVEKPATPSPQQYRWHEQERIMFVCLDPCTWQGREYDNHSTPLERINPIKLNTDQWCETAKLWGAKEILFVAKHTGGFCWWQTETTDYGIKNTPYKNGKGDVLKELSESCRKYGLNLGIYVYPGDETWGGVPFEERRHVGSWMVPSFDPELNLVLVGTSVTSPAPKFRLGGVDNKHLYHNSTLALDADTGEIVCTTST